MRTLVTASILAAAAALALPALAQTTNPGLSSPLAQNDAGRTSPLAQRDSGQDSRLAKSPGKSETSPGDLKNDSGAKNAKKFAPGQSNSKK